MASFRNKKILVTTFSTSNPDYGYLKYLSNLQGLYKNLIVIAVPAIDFGGESNDVKQNAVRDSLPVNIILIKPARVDKKNGVLQNDLFRWLTDDKENAHFNVDVTRDDQVYVISESGVLYAVLQKPLRAEVISTVLDQPDVKQ